MLLRVKNMKGLNKRTSAVDSKVDDASDVLNVEKDSLGNIVKRYGYDLLVAHSISPFDAVEYVKGLYNILFTSTGLAKELNGIMETISMSGTAPADGWASEVDTEEYSGCLYWTDVSGDTELYKFDGYTQYRAGVPQANIIYTAGGGAQKYYRAYLSFYDAQGNIHYGDFFQMSGLAGGTFGFSQPSSGFYERYGQANGNQTISAVDLTITMTSHNYVAGDWILLPQVTTFIGLPVKVESVTATVITLVSGSVGLNSFSVGNGFHIEIRWVMNVYESDNLSYGYGKIAEYRDLNRIASPTGLAPFAVGTPLEDDYDTTVLKGLPPRCKYIAVYHDVMVLGNNAKHQIFTTTGQAEEFIDTIFWSDTGLASTVETFPPFNKQQIGKSREGAISGLFADTDSMTIMKERQVYYLNGILIGRNFRVRSAKSNGIGCVSHQSIIEIEGGCIFMSSRGLHLTRNGQKPTELSDLIEPLFLSDTTGLDLSTAKSVNDIKNEKILVHIQATLEADDIVVVYDYYWKDFWIYKNIKARAGFTVVGTDTLYSVDATNIYKRSTSYNDNTVAIEAYYRTGWFSNEYPSIVKKFVKVIVSCVGAIYSTLSIKSQVDFIEGTDHTDTSTDITVTNQIDNKSLKSGSKKAIRLEFGNATVDKGMLLNGFEIEYEMKQESPKGNT